MKRRELLKSGLVIAGSAMLAGCGKEEEKTVAVSSDDFTIEPKQTDVYKLSVPMLFYEDAIKRFAKWNDEHKKIKIETLYNSIPWPLSESYNEWLQLCRGGSNPRITSFADYERYVKCSFDHGFKTCYLMNSPKPFNMKDLATFKDDLYKLLDFLWKIGVDNIKVANSQVAVLINEHNPAFKLTSSTIFEYNSIGQYAQLLELYPNFVNFGVAKNQNQNFRFLSNLRKRFPDKIIEIMVDEGCLKNCPTRVSCMSCSSTGYFKHGCRLTGKNKARAKVMNGAVQPWDYAYYSAIGINNFKSVPMHQRASDEDEPHVKVIMDVVEYGIDSTVGKRYIRELFPFLKNNNFDPKEVISYLPSTEHFIKHGHECDSKCGVECNYCFKKIEALEKEYKKAKISLTRT